MSEKKGTTRPHRGTEWRSIDLDGAPDIQEKGAAAFREFLSLWAEVCEATTQSKKAKSKGLPIKLADQLAQHLSGQIADYIGTFPDGTHVAVARQIIQGMFWDWMYTDTDEFLS